MNLFPSFKHVLVQGAVALPFLALLPRSAQAASHSAPQEQQVCAGADTSATCCPTPTPTGCVRTQGYWGNKPNVQWPAPYSRTATFFSSGLTWQAILDTPPAGGNGYIILAHQYIAAVLNRAAGASVPSALQTVLNQATAYFNSGADPSDCGGASCQTQKEWAQILDAYNNGNYAGAPSSCAD